MIPEISGFEARKTSSMFSTQIDRTTKKLPKQKRPKKKVIFQKFYNKYEYVKT